MVRCTRYGAMPDLSSPAPAHGACKEVGAYVTVCAKRAPRFGPNDGNKLGR